MVVGGEVWMAEQGTWAIHHLVQGYTTAVIPGIIYLCKDTRQRNTEQHARDLVMQRMTRLLRKVRI